MDSVKHLIESFEPRKWENLAPEGLGGLNRRRRKVKRQYYIRFRTPEGDHNSIRAELTTDDGESYVLKPKSFGLKGRVEVKVDDRGLMESQLLFGAMKLLDAVEIDYRPRSVRLLMESKVR